MGIPAVVMNFRIASLLSVSSSPHERRMKSMQCAIEMLSSFVAYHFISVCYQLLRVIGGFTDLRVAMNQLRYASGCLGKIRHGTNMFMALWGGPISSAADIHLWGVWLCKNGIVPRICGPTRR